MTAELALDGGSSKRPSNRMPKPLRASYLKPTPRCGTAEVPLPMASSFPDETIVFAPPPMSANGRIVAGSHPTPELRDERRARR